MLLAYIYRSITHRVHFLDKASRNLFICANICSSLPMQLGFTEQSARPRDVLGWDPIQSHHCCCDQSWKETRRFRDRQVGTEGTEKAEVETLSVQGLAVPFVCGATHCPTSCYPQLGLSNTVRVESHNILL